jgi:excisionase family DNA binding protein
MSELIYTPAELAEQLGVSDQTIRRLTAEGRLPHVRLSRQRVIYPKKQIDEWLAAESGASTVLYELEATT